MLAPLSWLKDFVDIDVTVEELEKRLFDSGFEVEQIIPYGDKLDKVVTCKITEITQKLIKHNISIFGIEIVSKSLEEIFLDIVNSKTKGQTSIV